MPGIASGTQTKAREIMTRLCIRARSRSDTPVRRAWGQHGELSMSKVALVTGAGRSIGFAVARRFLADGWRVALPDIDAALLDAAMAGLGAPDRILALPCDVADAAGVFPAVRQAAQQWGRLDALVNNAGTAVFKPILDTTPEDLGARARRQPDQAVPDRPGGGAGHGRSRRRRGSERHLHLRPARVHAAGGPRHQQGGLGPLAKQQAVELAALSIRVNAVAPGPVDTAMAKAVHTVEIRRDYHDAVPLARYGLEEELATVIVFLCGEQASYVTGQEIAVAGGFAVAGIGLPTLRHARRNL
jgi:NAD(P)-dependent dehydrogenase (short-subunit alcohol dehydrogenase family)